MDIVEFAERFFDTEIPEWQKNHIRTLYEVSKENDIYIVKGRYGFRTYVTPKTLKELTQNGKTLDSRNPLSSMR